MERKKKVSEKSPGIQRMIESIRQLQEKKGPYYERWRENLKRSLEKL